jgi:HTH-type transcriptional regulator/antitoxin HigA
VTEPEYRAALVRFDQIFDALPGTPEYDELDALATVIDVYENEAYPNPLLVDTKEGH